MKRNPSIELYRVLAMLGICILHGSIIQGHSPRTWWINLWPWCVNAFVFISGYFGCSFKPSRIVRLYGTALAAAFSVNLVNRAIGGGINPLDCLIGAWPMIKGFWFLHAYVLMMAFAPLVDAAVKAAGMTVAIPLCLATFGWSFSQTLPIIHTYVPTTPGLESYSCLALLGTYAVACVYRLLDCEKRWRPRWVAVAFAVLMALSSLGLCEYDSPIAAALACCGFYFMSRLTIDSPIVCRAVFLLAPSMFAVYVISVGGGWDVIQWVVLAFDRYSVVMAATLAGLAVFLFSVAVDIPRRIVCSLSGGLLNKMANRFDATYGRVVRCCGERWWQDDENIPDKS